MRSGDASADRPGMNPLATEKRRLEPAKGLGFIPENWSVLLAVFLLAPACTAEEKQPPKGETLERLKVRVVAEYPHDPAAYTQGLLYEGGGRLLESTGLRGASTLRRVELETGRVLQEHKLDRHLFAEGMAQVGERLYQLTWQSELGLIYKADTFAADGQFEYRGEGWGLCFDGAHLVMSNGSPTLSFHDPDGFAEVRRVEVKLEGRPLSNLNELACVDGVVYANLLGSEQIARIEPRNGRVTALIDASGLLTPRERLQTDVLNGIAFNSETGLFYLTGKLWPKLFAVEFGPP